MIEPGIYKEVMASFPSGVTVVTTLDPEGALVGITASAFTALSRHAGLCAARAPVSGCAGRTVARPGLRTAAAA